LLLLALALVRIAIGFIPVPTSAIAASSVAVSVFFVAVPIFALFAASSATWRWQTALALVVGGALVQVGGALAARQLGDPLAQGVLISLSQTGLVFWCFGIGALLALILKDQNLLLPIAIFLALFDMWLVFAPEGFVQQSMKAAPQVLGNIAYQVPSPQTQPTGGLARPLLYVGPADYLFLSMFFVALHRFRMRTQATFRWMVPVLAIYLLIVLTLGDVQLGPIRLGALPALVPIGIVVLLVNRKEFRLTRDEKISTLLILVLGSAVVTWRILQPPPAPEPQPEPANAAPAPEGQAPPPSQRRDDPGRFL